jgi:DNA-binding NarL/FixJ family response regulator
MRVVLCDDHALLLDALGASLVTHGHTVVFAATEPGAAVEAVRDHRPDLLLLDAYFPAGSGLEAAATVTREVPETKVVFLSASTDPDLVSAALESGAVGFVRKDHGLERILRALDRVEAGEIVMEAQLFRAVVARTREPERHDVRWLAQFLTEREREVLARIVAGESTDQMARAMEVARSTARTHVQNVLQKLGVHSRLQAATSVLGDREREWLRNQVTGLQQMR